MANKGESVQTQPTPPPANTTGGASNTHPVLPDNDHFPSGSVSSNRKKQKKQKKQQQQNPSAQALSNGSTLESPAMPEVSPSAAVAPTQDRSDSHNLAPSSSIDPNVQQTSNSSQANKKKKKTKAAALDPGTPALNNDPGAVDNPGAHRLARENSLWDTNGPEERSRIKAFWLNLTESERRDLVNIEKSHVLQKMKEQQKHSCSCSVCGRKRTAIEEELESLLKDPRIWADPTTNPPTDRLPVPTSALTGSSQRRHGFFKNKDIEEYDVDDQGEYSDGYDDDEEDYSDDDPVASSFFQFGNSLTVKDGLLTVADDLLKNDGQKFIDMMEQLAERRMQREEDARYSAAHGYPHGSLSPPHGANHLGEPPLEDDEYDDEDDDYDDDADLDYDDEDEEDMDTLTEEQRMEEGRRMFQIFAARMFEQRVVTAYREKVAYERQQALIDEQEQDTVGAADAKKSKNAEKKKRQRQAAKEAKALKEAAKEEEKQRKEAAVRAAEEKKKEEQRLKQEEQRKKKEAEKKALDDKKRKKEAEAQKRLEAERERQQEQERKNREQKAEEKRRRDEAEKKKREEKEAREAHDRHVVEEPEKKEHEDKTKTADGETQERVQKTDLEAQPAEPTASSVGTAGSPTPIVAPEHVQTSRSASSDPTRRPPPAAAVAVPPALKSRASQTSHDSPLAKVATPALPKAPTPSRVRETPNLQTSEPYTADRTPQSRSSTSPKAAFPQSIQHPGIPLPRQHPIPMSQAPQPPLMPPGVPPQPSSAQPPLSGQPFGSMPYGVNGLPGATGSVGASNMHRLPPGQQPSMFPSQAGFPHSVGSHPQRTGTHSIATGSQTSRAPFGDFGTGNFNQQLPPTAQPLYSPPQRERPPPNMQHARQLSNQFEGLSLDTQSVQQPAVSQPIGRPAPIKRPPSDNKAEIRGQDRPKSSSRNQDIDDLSNHLGSSALLDDTDEPLPTSMTENRRPSAAPGTTLRSSSSAVGSPFDYITSPFGSASRAPGESWNRTPAMPYGAPGMTSLGHSQSSSAWTGPDINSPSQGWGPTTGTSSNTNAFGIPPPHRSAGGNPRAVTVRMFTVQACKSLASQSSGVENTGFFDISDVVRVTVEGGRQMHLSPGIQLSEIRNILDTEGDSNNGGGTFLVRTLEPKGSMGNRTMVRWMPDQAPMESYSRQSPFYHQHPAHHQPSYQGEHLQGGLGQSSAGGASASRQGLGLGDVGSPVSDARLPNLGGLGRF